MCKSFRSTYLLILKHLMLIMWITLLTLIFCKMFRIYNKEPEYAFLRSMLGITLCISRGTVPLIYLTISLVIFPVCKTFNQIVYGLLSKISTKWLALYLEKAKVIHMTLTIGLVIISIIHSAAHIMNAKNYVKNYSEHNAGLNWAKGPNDTMFRLIFVTPTGVSGVVMLIILLTIWAWSTRTIRDRSYNVFSITHYLFIAFYGLVYVHSLGGIIKYQSNISSYESDCGRINATNLRNSQKCAQMAEFSAGIKKGWICPTIAIAVFLIDLTVRFIRRNSSRLNVLEALPFPGHAVFLRFKMARGKLLIKPCQYILLNCPNISRLEWHPFTVTQCPTDDDPSFTVLIGARGDWTQDLLKKVQYSCFPLDETGFLGTTRSHLEFGIEGPFPSSLEEFKNQEILVFIAAGVGITPFMPILEYIRKNNKSPRRVHLIWVTKCFQQFLWCTNLFHSTLEELWTENMPDRLDIQLYTTERLDMKKCFNYLETLNSLAYLQHRIHTGRPNWNDYFKYLGCLYERKKVAIFCSGPKALTANIRDICTTRNNNGFNYIFMHEGFS